ncbi:MAG: hypothetical protein JSS99_03940 [Actinobacteria bacterium]|nr:hypothetical protein [Actinomycetota bacterium]
MATRRQHRRRLERRVEAARRRRRECLYCRSTTNEFSAEEHIVPTALGNKKTVLPPGIVCRPCNNGPLSMLDKQPLRLRSSRAHASAARPPRPRWVPVSRWTNAHISRDENDHLFIDCRDGKPAMRPDPSVPNRHTLTLHARRMTPRYTRDLVRALYKVLLGFICLDQGQRAAMSERFDEARAMILGAQHFHGYLALLCHSEPHALVHFAYQEVAIMDAPTIAMHADFFGVNLITDLDRRQVVDPSRVPRDQIAVIEF